MILHRFPIATKFKHPHTKISKKGIKGLKNVTQHTKNYVFKVKEFCYITPNLTETIRRILSKRKIRRIQWHYFPSLSLSAKPLQTRMGKGKGKHAKWVAPIEKGKPLFEISNKRSSKIINKVYERIAFRLPAFSKLISRKQPKQTRLITSTSKSILQK